MSGTTLDIEAVPCTVCCNICLKCIKPLSCFCVILSECGIAFQCSKDLDVETIAFNTTVDKFVASTSSLLQPQPTAFIVLGDNNVSTAIGFQRTNLIKCNFTNKGERDERITNTVLTETAERFYASFRHCGKSIIEYTELIEHHHSNAGLRTSSENSLIHIENFLEQNAHVDLVCCIDKHIEHQNFLLVRNRNCPLPTCLNIVTGNVCIAFIGIVVLVKCR